MVGVAFWRKKQLKNLRFNNKKEKPFDRVRYCSGRGNGIKNYT
jgi:hypothetical protein